MRDEQLVSVLISIYKEHVSVASQAIDSIRKQTYRNLEIVIMLDCPENKSMKAYLRQIADEDARVNYYINKKNLGLLKSLNLGINLCHGEFICRMDGDDISEADRIEEQMNFMRKAGIDLVGSYTQLMNMNGELTGEVRKFPSHHNYLCRYLKYGSAVPHPTWLVKKEVYKELHGYRDILYVEDYDFLIRACLKGYKIGVVPEALIRYRINQSGITQRNIAMQKIMSVVLAKQVFQRRIFSIEEIIEYRTKRSAEEEKVMSYYLIGKKWKNGEKITIEEKFKVIFSGYNFMEIKQRLACRFILIKDNKYDNNQNSGRLG